MNSRPVLLFFVVALLATSIQTVFPHLLIAQSGSDAQAQIASVLDQWSVDWKARDAGAISALYAQDAIIYPAIDRRVNPQDTVGILKDPTPSGTILSNSLTDSPTQR